MSIKKNRLLAGITLIEVLVAIYVFGIGILVVMRMLLSNISWLYDIRAKDTAVSLAKESMDIVFHLRDSNIEKGMPRDCRSISQSPGRQCDGSLLTGGLNRYQVNRTLTGLYQLTALGNTGDAVIWYHTGTVYTQSGNAFTGFWYNHDPIGGVATPYTRWIEIFPQTNYPVYTGYVLGVRSIVVYQRGNRLQEVVLESIVGDMR